MMKFPRAREPANFGAAVAKDLDFIRKEIAAHRRPNFEGRDTWGRFKTELAAATHGKCGYCEVTVVGVDRFRGDVEHFRPKGRVDRLVIDANGKRRSAPLFASGYHWLAYQWTNYVLTCNPCNSANKRNFFPLRAEPAAAPAVGDERREDALLLSPFGRKDPAKHLTFDHLGVIGSRRGSRYGKATIEVCGLDRTLLEKKRRLLAGTVQKLLDVLADAASSDEKVDLAIEILRDLGAQEKEHAGMVRSMFTEATKQPWSAIAG